MSRFVIATLAIFTIGFGLASRAQAQLDVFPRSINFFNTEVGGTSFSETIYVTNYSNRVVELRTYDNCYSDFRVDDFNCNYPLNPGGRCAIRIQFTPYSPGYKWCSIDINDRYGSFERVNVSGNATERPR